MKKITSILLSLSIASSAFAYAQAYKYDVNFDGIEDGKDLYFVVQHFGPVWPKATYWEYYQASCCDFDHNGYVNETDRLEIYNYLQSKK